MKASGSLKEPGSVHLGLFKIDAVELMVAKAVAAGREFMIFKNVFPIHSVNRTPLNFSEACLNLVSCHMILKSGVVSLACSGKCFSVIEHSSQQREIRICLGFRYLHTIP